MRIDKDLVAAVATPLVLGIISEGPSYGYAILTRVRELSDGELEWSDGMLYPLLHRLEGLEHLKAEWGSSPEGRRRKYYAITPAGRRALEEQRTQWSAVNRALGRIWQLAPGPTPLARAHRGLGLADGATA